MQSVAMTLMLIAAVVCAVLLTTTFFPRILDRNESWLAYAATMQ